MKPCSTISNNKTHLESSLGSLNQCQPKLDTPSEHQPKYSQVENYTLNIWNGINIQNIFIYDKLISIDNH